MECLPPIRDLRQAVGGLHISEGRKFRAEGSPPIRFLPQAVWGIIISQGRMEGGGFASDIGFPPAVWMLIISWDPKLKVEASPPTGFLVRLVGAYNFRRPRIEGKGSASDPGSSSGRWRASNFPGRKFGGFALCSGAVQKGGACEDPCPSVD